MSIFVTVISLGFQLYEFLILIRVFLTWINTDPYNPVIRHPIVRILHRVTEPVLQPLRRVIPPHRGHGGHHARHRPHLARDPAPRSRQLPDQPVGSKTIQAASGDCGGAPDVEVMPCACWRKATVIAGNFSHLACV